MHLSSYGEGGGEAWTGFIHHPSSFHVFETATAFECSASHCMEVQLSFTHVMHVQYPLHCSWVYECKPAYVISEAREHSNMEWGSFLSLQYFTTETVVRESQNHSTSQLGRVPHGSLSPTPVSSQHKQFKPHFQAPLELRPRSLPWASCSSPPPPGEQPFPDPSPTLSEAPGAGSLPSRPSTRPASAAGSCPATESRGQTAFSPGWETAISRERRAAEPRSGR